MKCEVWCSFHLLLLSPLQFWTPWTSCHVLTCEQRSPQSNTELTQTLPQSWNQRKNWQNQRPWPPSWWVLRMPLFVHTTPIIVDHLDHPLSVTLKLCRAQIWPISFVLGRFLEMDRFFKHWQVIDWFTSLWGLCPNMPKYVRHAKQRSPVTVVTFIA